MKQLGRKMGITLALAAAPLTAMAAGGQIQKLSLAPTGDHMVLVVAHSGDGKFRLFRSEKQGTVIIEAEDLTLPPKLTKLVDVSKSNGPVLQMTPYNSQKGPHAMAKLVLQLRQKAEVTGSELPGKFVVEIRKQAPLAAEAAAARAKDEVRARAAAVEKSEDVAKKLVDVLNSSDDEKKYFGSRVTFEAKDAEVPDIFRLVGETSGLNIIWDPEVGAQKTSIWVRDVPWDQILDLVMQQKGFKAAVAGNVVRILTQDTYNKQIQAKNTELSLSDNLEPVVMAVIPLSFTDAAAMKTLITDLLQDKAAAAAATGTTAPTALISPDQSFKRGRIEVDSRTNALVVTNTKEAIERIRRLVKELDVAVPQILIDSKVIVASDTFSKDIGVRWQEHVKSESGNAGSAAAFNNGNEVLGGGSSAADAVSPFAIGATQNQGVIGVGFGASDRANIKAALELAEVNGYAKTVASPRITVGNNKPANISAGQTITQLVPGSGNQDAAKNTTSAMLSLSVIPQVTSHGSVQLKSLSISDTALGAVTATTAATDAKTLTTDVLVDSGGTLVLGGIFQVASSSASDGIPVLKDLPFLGQLFRVNTESKKKDELMVFITPQILNPEGQSQSL